MKRTVPFLNGCISFVAFITALSLVVYMLIAFITGMFDVGMLMFDTVFLEPAKRQDIFNTIFDETQFHRENNIAHQLEGVINVKRGMVNGFYSDTVITFNNCLRLK